MEALFDLSPDFLKELQIVDWSYTEDLEAKTFKYYDDWVKQKKHGSLNYMADHRKDLRKSLTDFFPECKSTLVFLFTYTHAAKRNLEEHDSSIASYVKGFEGLDYHHWIKDKLLMIANKLGLNDGDFKLSIDAQPVLERDLAHRAGLGWFGKNTMLIHQQEGSFVLISSILLNKSYDLGKKQIVPNHCGNCTKCIDACPTNAIEKDYLINSNKCISHFTIELFKDTPRPKEFSNDRAEIFGCDICQNVCPWNNKPLKKEYNFQVSNFDFFKRELSMIKKDLESMSNREFRRRFKGTPLERTGRVGLLKNIFIDNGK